MAHRLKLIPKMWEGGIVKSDDGDPVYNYESDLSGTPIEAIYTQHEPPKSKMHIITEGDIYGPNENYPDAGYPGYIGKYGENIITDLNLEDLRQNDPNITIDDVCNAFGITKEELGKVNEGNFKNNRILHIPFTKNSYKAMARWGVISRMNQPFSDMRDYTNPSLLVNIPEGIDETYDVPESTYFDYLSVGPDIGAYFTVPNITHTPVARRATRKKQKPSLRSGPHRFVRDWGNKIVKFLRPLETGSVSAGMPVYRWDDED